MLCVLSWLCAYPVSILYKEPRLIAVTMWLGVTALLAGLTNPRQILLQRKLIFWQEFVLNVSQKIAAFVVSVGIAVVYRSYWALVIGTLAGQLTGIVVSYWVLPFRPHMTFRHLREFLSYSGWLSAGLLIGKMIDGAALGYYTVGSNLAMIPTREVIAPLTQTIFPGFANIRDDPARLAAAYQRAQALTTAVALPVGAGFALVADPLVRLALGEQWIPVIFIIQSLAAIFAFHTLGSLVQPLGLAKGETRLLFIRDTQLLFMRIPIVIAGMWLYGLEGLVVGRLVTGLFGTVINMCLVRRFIGVTVLQQFAANARALLSVATMAAAVSCVSHYLPHTTSQGVLTLQLAVLIVLGAAVYCGSTYLLWLMTKRPSGPEIEIQKIVGRLLARARPA
jgi:lipopolysaccharide exporter